TKGGGLDSDAHPPNHPRILISTYSYLANTGRPFPDRGDRLTWNVIQHLTSSCELWVLTCHKNQQAIEKNLAAHPLPGVTLEYVALPRWLDPLLRVISNLHMYAYL